MALPFPLEMKNGVRVRKIDDLRENFDINKVVSLFFSGKLLQWLEARDYDEERDAVSKLDESDPELAKKLCDIFDVEYVPTEVIYTKKVIEQNERLLKLKQYTDDEVIADNVDFVAFEQSELIKLVQGGSKCVYMCGERFFIPMKEGVKYIGVDEPEVSFESENVMKLYIDNEIEVLNSKFSPECQKEINRKKNYRIEARITKFYKHEENQEYWNLWRETYGSCDEDYYQSVHGNVCKLYNTDAYVFRAAHYCDSQFHLYQRTCETHNDENGEYRKITCLYRIYDDKEELLFGKKIGIKRYSASDKYVFFTGCYSFDRDYLYVFDKRTEQISLLKEAKEIKLVCAYDDKCIFGCSSFSTCYYYSIDTSGKETDLNIWELDAYPEWNKDGCDIYEGYVQHCIFYRASENGIYTFDLNTGATGKIYDKGKLVRKIIINANTMYFCQNNEVIAYSLSDKSIKKLVQGQYDTGIEKIDENKLIYHSGYPRQKYELDLDTLKSKEICRR